MCLRIRQPTNMVDRHAVLEKYARGCFTLRAAFAFTALALSITAVISLLAIVWGSTLDLRVEPGLPLSYVRARSVAFQLVFSRSLLGRSTSNKLGVFIYQKRVTAGT